VAERLAHRFAGRTCLVTGGGRGIGRGIALALGREGGRVAVASRTASECEAVVAELRALGADALAVPLDVTDGAACTAAVARTRAELGRVQVLVHAAGVSPVRRRAEQHGTEEFRRIVDVNLSGAFAVSAAAASDLLDGGGSVLVLASTLAAAGSPRLAAYGASKAGLIQLAGTLAREWADRGVRVNALAPGYVETRMTEELLAVERLRDEVLSSTPMGRLGEVEEIVGPALFLLSDEASYITGAVLTVDGGMGA
jgi:3-oxoacyl-[acyl-carrier protein] reductase